MRFPTLRGYSGSCDALSTLLRLNASQALLYAISTLQPTDSVALKAALTRALRALAAAIAETVGPSQWGLSPSTSVLRREAKEALEYFFQVRILRHPKMRCLSSSVTAGSARRLHTSSC